MTTVLGQLAARQPTAYRLSDAARKRLAGRMAPLAAPDGRSRLILGWAAARGRVSTTEIADICALSVTYTGSLLTGLESDGLLAPGRATKAGRGFYYVPVP